MTPRPDGTNRTSAPWPKPPLTGPGATMKARAGNSRPSVLSCLDPPTARTVSAPAANASRTARSSEGTAKLAGSRAGVGRAVGLGPPTELQATPSGSNAPNALSRTIQPRYNRRGRGAFPTRGGSERRRRAPRRPHVDRLRRLLEDARAVRRAGRDAIRVARRKDALLAGDHHGERSLHHEAELLDVVLVRLDDGLGREVENDEGGVVCVHHTALHTRSGLDGGKVARARVVELRHERELRRGLGGRGFVALD